MVTGRSSGKAASRAGYFDRFWGCPGCLRALSIAEIIERHCEDCDTDIQPTQMSEAKSVAEATDRQVLP